MNLCSYSIPDGTYTFYVQAVGKPSILNQISSGLAAKVHCGTGGTPSGPGLTLNLSAPTMTLAAGGSGIVTVSVAPQSGALDSAVALGCSNLPSNLKCLFAPGSVTPGANTASSVLTIDATARSAATNHGEFRSFYVADGWLGFGLFGIVFLAKLDRRRLVSLVVVAILGLSVLGSLSCGGGSPVASPSSPVANSYAVTVTGNAGSTQASTAITVTVN